LDRVKLHTTLNTCRSFPTNFYTGQGHELDFTSEAFVVLESWFWDQLAWFLRFTTENTFSVTIRKPCNRIVPSRRNIKNNSSSVARDEIDLKDHLPRSTILASKTYYLPTSEQHRNSTHDKQTRLVEHRSASPTRTRPLVPSSGATVVGQSGSNFTKKSC
jgi:hypothetical protein